MGILKSAGSICVGYVPGKNQTHRVERLREQVDFVILSFRVMQGAALHCGLTELGLSLQMGSRSKCPGLTARWAHSLLQAETIKAVTTAKEPTHPEEQRLFHFPDRSRNR